MREGGLKKAEIFFIHTYIMLFLMVIDILLPPLK